MPTKDTNETSHPRMQNKANKARREKELIQLKWMKRAGIALAVVILVLIILGVIYEYVYKPNKILARVQDEKITVSNFQEAVRYQRSNLINNYTYLSQLYSSFGITMDEATKNSYETQLSPEYAGFIGNEVLNSLVNQKVLDYGAKEAGFSISDEEVNQRLQSLFGYYPNGTPTPQPTSEPFLSTPTISEEQLAILKYTATPEATEAISDLSGISEAGPDASVPEIATDVAATPTETVSASAESETLQETAVEETSEESAGGETTATPAEISDPTAVSSPTPSLTPTEYTEEMYQDLVDQQFTSSAYFSKEFFTKQIYYELLQEKVTDSLTKDITNEAEMVWARHILVGTEEEARSVIDRLNAGEDWAALAAELSQDTSNKDNGGDLGWFMRESMVEAFEEAAFSQEVGTISQEPVSTTYGFHILQIIGHEVRPLTSSEKQTAIDNAYNAWLAAAREKLKVDIGNDWTNFVPTDPELDPYL